MAETKVKLTPVRLAVLARLAASGDWHNGSEFKSAAPKCPLTGRLHGQYGRKARGLPWITFIPMVEAGFIEQRDDRLHRRFFRITDAGREVLAEAVRHD